MTVEQRLEKIEAMLTVLVERQTVKDFYEIDEFARLVGKAPFTCREWARLGRIRAEKRNSGRGAHSAWVVSHAEFQRYQREGLLPLSERTPSKVPKEVFKMPPFGCEGRFLLTSSGKLRLIRLE
jgi:hypothetical protein